MKHFTRILCCMVALVLGSAPAIAQTTTTSTSVSAALAGGAQNNILTVVSASGMSASTSSTQTFVYVAGGAGPREQMQIASISGSTLTVRRATNGTAVPHAIGETVWYGTVGSFNVNTGTAYGVFVSTVPWGQCTRTSQQFLPVITPSTGDISDCILSPPQGSPTAALSTTGRWSSVNNRQAASQRPYKKLAVTATTYTALPTDYIIGYNTNVNGTLTLPALTGWVGKEYIAQLEITGTHSLTIAPSAGGSINGSAASIIVGGATSFGGVHLYTDGNNAWFTRRAH